MTEQAKKNLIVIAYPGENNQSVTLDAERGDWTDYDYNGDMFIVRCGNALVGLYNVRHTRSIEIKASVKEATPNV